MMASRRWASPTCLSSESQRPDPSGPRWAIASRMAISSIVFTGGWSEPRASIPATPHMTACGSGCSEAAWPEKKLQAGPMLQHAIATNDPEFDCYILKYGIISYRGAAFIAAGGDAGCLCLQPTAAPPRAVPHPPRANATTTAGDKGWPPQPGGQNAGIVH